MDYYISNDYDYSGIFGFLGGILILILLLSVAFSIIQIVALWKLYKKAGKNGWEAIIPFYNNWILVEISGLDWWWFLLFFAPTILPFLGLGVFGWIAYLITIFNCYYNLAKKFDRDLGFAICLTLFAPICIPIAAFSKNFVYNKNITVSNNGVFPSSLKNNNSNSNYYTNNNSSDSVDVSEYNFCGNCGTKLDKEAKFCPNCGHAKR